MQINVANLAALFRGYRVQYLEAYQAAKPQWPEIAMKTSSSSAEELYHWLGAVPGMRKLVGEIVIQNLSAAKYSIPNDEFESTIAVKQADIERDSYGIYNPLFQSMGLAAAEHPDELTTALLVNGFTTKDYTGKNFFDTAKKQRADAKFSFDNKGTKKLSADNLVAARTGIKSIVNSEGRPMALGRDLVLMVSPKNEQLARLILQADFIQVATPGATSAVGGVTNVNKGTMRFVVWNRLAGASENMWFIYDAGYPVKPFIFQEEKATQMQSLNSPTDDHVFKKHEFLYQAYGRYNGGYGLPELAFGSTGVDAA
jgi:phage major head subunit gpT-like protein